jgi:SAM-dependent methyltransferase
MRKFDNNKFKDFAYLFYRWLSPIIDPIRVLRAVPGFFGYFNDLINYKKMEGSEPVKIVDTYPCIHDKTRTTGFDSHYFYQDIWAFRKIYESKTNHHVDVGSRVDFVGFLSVITKITFVDIRPLMVNLENFDPKEGSILSLPFGDNSIFSLSCLHVAEHIGLGRYGDQLDPRGTEKAIKELSRVLAPKGNLYLSLPAGKTRLCFNAHRIHSAKQILEYCCELQLLEFSGIDDAGNFLRNIDMTVLENSDYACGLFWFTKN